MIAEFTGALDFEYIQRWKNVFTDIFWLKKKSKKKHTAKFIARWNLNSVLPAKSFENFLCKDQLDFKSFSINKADSIIEIET